MKPASIRHALSALGLYRNARDLLNLVARPAERRRLWQSEEFYRTFISKGDIVFDVGANVGERTETFLRLGARVVAIEPNIECCQILRGIYRYSSVAIEPVAAGSSAGTSELRQCAISKMSSMSEYWIDRVKDRRFRDLHWDRTTTVPVVTLDDLIAKHGTPQFIKIDVEGFETTVLSGLNHAIPAMSFEHTPECLGLTKECLRRISKLGEYEFNVSLAENMKLELDEWATPEGITKILESKFCLGGGTTEYQYADVYARLLTTRPRALSRGESPGDPMAQRGARET